jgi:hypothetical protein
VLIDSGYLFNTFHFLQFAADGLYILNIMYIQLDLTLKYTVFSGNGNFVDVDIHLSGKYVGDAVQNTDIVNTTDFDGGREEQGFV